MRRGPRPRGAGDRQCRVETTDGRCPRTIHRRGLCGPCYREALAVGELPRLRRDEPRPRAASVLVEAGEDLRAAMAERARALGITAGAAWCVAADAWLERAR